MTSLPKGLPEHTLGFEVLDWCSRWLRQPDGPDAGGKFEFTREQVRFVAWWYAIDRTGRFVHHRGVLRRCKGWGKSPMMAALALAELCGPVRFKEFKAGEPVGEIVVPAWVELAGVSLDQTNNTMTMVRAMVNESPIVDEYGLDVGLTRIYTANGGQLKGITASASTQEGARPTFVVEDETHWWTQTNGGHALHEVNRRNLGKSRGGSARMLETTNAHIPGQDSVAERSYDAWQHQLVTGTGGLFYDTREAPPGIDLDDEENVREALRVARGDSHWLDLDRTMAEIADNMSESDIHRFYFNQLDGAFDAWLTEPEWGACGVHERIVADGTPITLGFDGSRSREKGVTDATALIACTLDGYLFEPLPISVWEQHPDQKHFEIPTVEVDASIRQVFKQYKVVGFYADPVMWESYVAGWEAAYVSQLQVTATREHPISWRMTGGRNSLVIRALEQFHSAVIDRELTHSAENFALNRHVVNARRNPTMQGLQIAKETKSSARKIDAAVAAVLAWQARIDAISKGVALPSKTFTPKVIR